MNKTANIDWPEYDFTRTLNVVLLELYSSMCNSIKITCSVAYPPPFNSSDDAYSYSYYDGDKKACLITLIPRQK